MKTTKTSFAVLLSVALLFSITSCKKKDEQPSPAPSSPTGITIESELQVKCEIDGQPLHLEKGKDSVSFTSGKILSYEDFDDTMPEIRYSCGYIQQHTGRQLLAIRGKVEVRDGTKPTVPAFEGLFNKGNLPYMKDLAEIEYTDENGDIWTTNLGSQAGSLTISDVQTTGQIIVKVLLKFDCTVYNKKDTAKSKKITNGVMIGFYNGN